MTQIWSGEGKVIPVTLIEAGPCRVLQLKTKEKDGYEAFQVGYGEKYLREFRGHGEQKLGDEITVSLFQEGEKVAVSGFSKGKGFQGGVKRWGFHGRHRGRGTKHEERTLGSVGAARPSEVWKGKKMPGHMGAARVTVKNLMVFKVDPQHNILAVRGAVPGRRGTLLEMKSIK